MGGCLGDGHVALLEGAREAGDDVWSAEVTALGRALLDELGETGDVRLEPAVCWGSMQNTVPEVFRTV